MFWNKTYEKDMEENEEIEQWNMKRCSELRKDIVRYDDERRNDERRGGNTSKRCRGKGRKRIMKCKEKLGIREGNCESWKEHR